MSSSGCSSCSCSSFHPHLFLPLKCLGCPHPKAAHNGGAGGAAAAEDSEPITAATPTEPTPAPAPAPAAAAAAASSPAPQKPPPPLPSVLAAAPAPAAAAPAPAATLAAPAPPPKRGSMPPPIPSTLQKQWSGGAEPASTASPTAAGASAATSQPPQPTQPRPPPRPSIIAPAGTVLLGSGAFPARSAPPPLPASSASAASSPSNASAAPQTQPAGSAPINIPASSSGSGSGPPPVPLHLRTDSGVNSAEVLFSPSPSTSASLAALLVGGGGAGGTGGAAGTTPFSPASSIGSPDPSNRGGSLNSRPPPLPSQPAAEPAAASSSTVLTSPKGVSASAGFSNASQGQDQQWVDPNYRPSFAQKLHHKFDVVVDQSNTGMHLLKRVRAFMQRFSSLQERYAAELSKITSLERNKLIASAHADGMSSCYTAWLGFFANMDELAVANQHFSEQLKEVTVEQLERFYGIGTQMVKDNKVEQERVSNHMLKVHVAVAKERDAASQALQKLAAKKLDTSSDGAAAGAGGAAGSGGAAASAGSGKSSGAAGQSGSFSLFKSSPSSKGFEKAKTETIRACESYSLSLASANREHDKYHQQDLPGMLTQMQSLEEMRLHSLNTALANFSALQKQYTTKLTAISSDNQSLAQGMDANQDIHHFVHMVCAVHGPALAPMPFTYDLPISLSELRAMAWDEPPSSLFYSTLEGVMKHQKTMEGTAGSTANAVSAACAGSTRALSLDLPLLIPTLLRNIVENDGCRSEGIFRISVGSEELTRIRRQLEQGDFQLRQPNPHVSACLLKSWFRDLLQPVMPWALYERCISVGQIEPFSASNPAHAASVRAIMSDLPPLNAKILALLFGFLKRLAAEVEWVAKTRMNLANLSLVFSPGLIKSEKNDPMQMLTDTKYASNFVYRAIECSPGCFSADAQESAKQLLEEIFSGVDTTTAG